MKERVSVQDRAKAPPNQHATAIPGEPATDGRARSLWFNAPIDDQDRRPQLTRQRVVAEALAVIAQDGVQALTMRRLAARLGVVPGALYHHVGNKQQLQDLVLDGVLAEVDFHLKPSLGLEPAAQDPGPPAARGARGPSRGGRDPQDPRPARPALSGPGRGAPWAVAGGRVR